ncbi:MAG: hypothetical protein ACF8MJ_04495 [Phycisphaerales bacterium JB050]
MNEHGSEDGMNEPIEQELMGLPERAMELGAIERIEDALAAEAVLGPAIIEPEPGLLSRRVPVWGMLAACLLLTCGAGVLGWMVKPVETVERIRVVTEPAPEPAPTVKEETPKATPIVEIVRLERPLFERPSDRTGIDPSRWTMGH